MQRSHAWTLLLFLCGLITCSSCSKTQPETEKKTQLKIMKSEKTSQPQNKPQVKVETDKPNSSWMLPPALPLEIPNGTSPTLDATGQIAFDLSADTASDVLFDGLEKFDTAEDTTAWRIKLLRGSIKLAQYEKQSGEKFGDDKLLRELVMMIFGAMLVQKNKQGKLPSKIRTLISAGELYKEKRIKPDTLRQLMRKIRRAEKHHAESMKIEEALERAKTPEI